MSLAVTSAARPSPPRWRKGPSRCRRRARACPRRFQGIEQVARHRLTARPGERPIGRRHARLPALPPTCARSDRSRWRASAGSPGTCGGDSQSVLASMNRTARGSGIGAVLVGHRRGVPSKPRWAASDCASHSLFFQAGGLVLAHPRRAVALFPADDRIGGGLPPTRPGGRRRRRHRAPRRVCLAQPPSAPAARASIKNVARGPHVPCP